MNRNTNNTALSLATQHGLHHKTTVSFRQRGLTLIETLISLSILAMVTVAATQVLQRAATLKDKIDAQADFLSEQLSLEQMLSRDILNSEVLIWPSESCGQVSQCFELALAPAMESNNTASPQRLRYRFSSHSFYRDEQYENSSWVTHDIPNTLSHVSFSFLLGRQWVSAEKPFSYTDNGNNDDSNYHPLGTKHKPPSVRALKVTWYREDHLSLQQTVIAP